LRKLYRKATNIFNDKIHNYITLVLRYQESKIKKYSRDKKNNITDIGFNCESYSLITDYVANYSAQDFFSLYF